MQIDIDNYEQLRYSSNPVVLQLDDNMQLTLINLPDVCLEAILSNLSYDEISRYRIVRLSFNIYREDSLLLIFFSWKAYPSYDFFSFGYRFAGNLIGFARSYSIVVLIWWKNIMHSAFARLKVSYQGENRNEEVILSRVIVIY